MARADAVLSITASRSVQAYISGLKLEGLALMADLVYISQSAARLMRCLFEICLRRNWAKLAESALLLCKAVQHRMWPSQTPLRQFKGKIKLPAQTLTTLERKDIPWDRCWPRSGSVELSSCLVQALRPWIATPQTLFVKIAMGASLTLMPLDVASHGCECLHVLEQGNAAPHDSMAQDKRPCCRHFDMRPAQLGELINAPSLGKVVKKMINMIPRLQLDATIQPLTRGLLRMDLILTPDFQWDQEQHGYVEPFLILVCSPTLPIACRPALCTQVHMPRQHETRACMHVWHGECSVRVYLWRQRVLEGTA
jgi:hypothetical protein